MTGGNHVGETLEQTVRREAFEELGLQLGEIIFTNYTFTFSDHGKDYVEYVYGAKMPPNTEVNLSAEHDEYRWATVDEAKALLKWDTNKRGLEALCELLLSKEAE